MSSRGTSPSVAPRGQFAVASASTLLMAGGCTALLEMPTPVLSPCAEGVGADCTVDVYVPEVSLADDAGATQTLADVATLEAHVDGAVVDTAQDSGDAMAADAGGDDGGGEDGGLGRVSQCGGGTFGQAVACTGAQALCCQGDLVAGQTTYSCASSGLSACPSTPNAYSIWCSGPSDCSQGYVCCHYKMGGMKCRTPDRCTRAQNGSVVCQPDAGDCPARPTSCTPSLTNAGVASPYAGCQY